MGDGVNINPYIGSMRYFKGMFVGVVSLFLAVSPAAVMAMQTGGTNYVVYDLGNYYQDPNETTYHWPDDVHGGMKTVIGSYDQNPGKVEADIVAMCNQGQRKIGLVVWFADFPDTMGFDVSYGGMINSHGGKLTDRHRNNLLAILELIKNARTDLGKPCFNEMQFRFAPYSNASALGWDQWYEDRYLLNKAFIFSTRDLVRNALRNSTVNVWFDLGVEEGGRTEGQIQSYRRRLWEDYVSQYSVNDTYGYSIALQPSRFTTALGTYDEVGVRPSQFAIDVYDLSGLGITSQLQILKTEMDQAGEGDTPIIIQETFFMDALVWQEIEEVRQSLGLGVRSVMQWQLERNKAYTSTGVFRHYTTTEPNYMYFGATTPGDIDGDGLVTIQDYWQISKHFGSIFNIFDFNSLVVNYGK